MAAPRVPGQETPRESERSRSHPGLAVLITTAGNACPERVSPGPFNWRLSEQVATSTPPALLRVPGQLARARAGGESRERWGPGSARSPTPRGAHRESAAGQWTPGLPRGFPPGWDPGGSRELGAACAPGPAPLTHTVSQQHQNRLARPRSAAAGRHRPSWASRAQEGARLPLPMEWRMSMEASRSVLSRD